MPKKDGTPTNKEAKAYLWLFLAIVWVVLSALFGIVSCTASLFQ